MDREGGGNSRPVTAESDGLDDCAFCRIAQGQESPSQIIAEGEDWLAFFPLHPATIGHTLVIPRVHVSDLWQASPELAAGLAGHCVTVGRAIESALSPDGMNLITSKGAAAEQSVFHLHLHLVPRWSDDRFGTIWPDSSADDGVDLSKVAVSIRNAWRTEASR
ncbi:HIT family protein [Kribbella sp. NPDC050820]|uniref:HIT family protein n=1 Tax=Kribbella sp. NPDC050820 TaxID=3155408 RepID=UPI0034068B3D